MSEEDAYSILSHMDLYDTEIIIADAAQNGYIDTIDMILSYYAYGSTPPSTNLIANMLITGGNVPICIHEYESPNYSLVEIAAKSAIMTRRRDVLSHLNKNYLICMSNDLIEYANMNNRRDMSNYIYQMIYSRY